MSERLVACKICQNQVSNKAKVCPHCGARLKMALWIKIVIALFIIAVINVIVSELNDSSYSAASAPQSAIAQKSGGNSNAVNPAIAAQAARESRPRNQIDFENVISKYSRDFRGAQNELQESALRKERKRAIAALNTGDIVNWVGVVSNIGTNEEGKAYIAIRINSELSVKTYNNAFSDLGDNTLIETGSNIYKLLYNNTIQKGSKVKFSGYFLRSDTDFYNESSMTIRGSMTDSEFIVKFSDIQPY